MASHFGGISPVRHQQKVRTLGLIGGFALVVCLAIVGVLFVSSDSSTASTAVKVPSSQAPVVEMEEVLVPVQQIAAGKALIPSMFKKESRPKQGLPDSGRVVHDFEEVKNQYSRSLIAAGVPLMIDYVTPIKPSSVITAAIPDGYRAVTIRVDAQSAVEGWARPGAHVDVVWATTNRGEKTVATIVHNAKILSAQSSTDVAMNAQGNGVLVPSTVTLLVTSKDAQKIQLAKTAGSLSLMLRGDSDVKAADGTPLSIGDLLGHAKRAETGERIDGTVVIGGKRWNVVGGKLKPSEED